MKTDFDGIQRNRWNSSSDGINWNTGGQAYYGGTGTSSANDALLDGNKIVYLYLKSNDTYLPSSSYRVKTFNISGNTLITNSDVPVHNYTLTAGAFYGSMAKDTNGYYWVAARMMNSTIFQDDPPCYSAIFRSAYPNDATSWEPQVNLTHLNYYSPTQYGSSIPDVVALDNGKVIVISKQETYYWFAGPFIPRVYISFYDGSQWQLYNGKPYYLLLNESQTSNRIRAIAEFDHQANTLHLVYGDQNGNLRHLKLNPPYGPNDWSAKPGALVASGLHVVRGQYGFGESDHSICMDFSTNPASMYAAYLKLNTTTQKRNYQIKRYDGLTGNWGAEEPFGIQTYGESNEVSMLKDCTDKVAAVYAISDVAPNKWGVMFQEYIRPINPVCIDNDGDNYGANCALGTDCDDNDGGVHALIACSYNGNACGNYNLCAASCPAPPAELCNDGLDNNCNSQTDEGCPITVNSYYQESNGRVVFEAENYDNKLDKSSKSWVFGNSILNFSSTGYMAALPNTGDSFTPNSSELSYNINFTSSGTYYLWLRGYAAAGSDDSCHVGFDSLPQPGGTLVSWFMPLNNWAWSNNSVGPPQKANITVSSAGMHKINLWMREDGFIADKIVLEKDPNYIPTGLGPQESPRISQNITISCTDADIDGFNVSASGCGIADCNDTNSNINPSAAELCGNGIDENCDGITANCTTPTGILFEDNFDNQPDWSPRQLTSGAVNCLSWGGCAGPPPPIGYDGYRLARSYYSNSGNNTINIDSTNYRGGNLGKGFTFWSESCTDCGWASDGLLFIKLAEPDSGYDELYTRFFMKMDPKWKWGNQYSSRTDPSDPAQKMFRYGHYDGELPGQTSTFDGQTGRFGPVGLIDFSAGNEGIGEFKIDAAPRTEVDPINGFDPDKSFLWENGALFGHDCDAGCSGTSGIFYIKDGNGIPQNWNSNCNSGECPNGMPNNGDWHSYELNVKLNSKCNVTDGIFRLWYDGELVMNITTFSWNGPNCAMPRKKWNYFIIGGNNDNPALDPATGSEQYYAIDDLVISTSYIGPNYVIGNQTCTDNDHDGYNISQINCGVADCNDNNTSINPSASEFCGNSIDENCDGTDLQCNKADIDKNNCIDSNELSAFVQRWFKSSADVSMRELVSAIKEWKRGC